MNSKHRPRHLDSRAIALLAALFLLPFAATTAPAQEKEKKSAAPDYGTPQEQAEQFISGFSTGAADVAIEELLQRNPFFDGAAVERGTVGVRKITSIVRLFLDHELIASENISKRYEALTYVLHFERQPILLQLRFYNVAESTWLVHSWHFSADAVALLDAVRDARESATVSSE